MVVTKFLVNQLYLSPPPFKTWFYLVQCSSSFTEIRLSRELPTTEDIHFLPHPLWPSRFGVKSSILALTETQRGTIGGVVVKTARSHMTDSMVPFPDLADWKTCQMCVHVCPNLERRREEKGLQCDHHPQKVLSLSLCWVHTPCSKFKQKIKPQTSRDPESLTQISHDYIWEHLMLLQSRTQQW